VANLYLNESDAELYAWESFGALTILVLIVSYLISLVNVQRSPHVQHPGSIHEERKLSVTLQVNI